MICTMYVTCWPHRITKTSSIPFNPAKPKLNTELFMNKPHPRWRIGTFGEIFPCGYCSLTAWRHSNLSVRTRNVPSVPIALRKLPSLTNVYCAFIVVDYWRENRFSIVSTFTLSNCIILAGFCCFGRMIYFLLNCYISEIEKFVNDNYWKLTLRSVAWVTKHWCCCRIIHQIAPRTCTCIYIYPENNIQAP